MAQFQEVLEEVRLVLTCGSQAEVRALLQGLVGEQIISEAYCRTLGLHPPIDSSSPDPAPDGHFSRVVESVEGSAGTPTSERLRTEVDRYQMLQDCCCRLDDGAPKPQSDSESVSRGSLGEEWVDQVEEVARRIAVPLWQQWERGHRMLLSLLPSEDRDTDGVCQVRQEPQAPDRPAQTLLGLTGTDAGLTEEAMLLPESCFSALTSCSSDGLLVDGHWDAMMMQDLDQDFLDSCLLFGELPDDLSEYLNEDNLDTDVLLGDPWFNSVDELDYYNDVTVATDVSNPANNDPQHQSAPTEKTKSRRKRQRAPQSQLNTTAKRQRAPAAARPKTKKSQAEPEAAPDSHAEPIPAKAVREISTSPPGILYRLITLPDTPTYQVVQLSPPATAAPPVFRLPLPHTATPPTYIIVPAAPPPRRLQMPPLSPVDGAVAPVQMSSSPPGSLSDTASKAMSPPCASPLSPSTETSPCKESPPPPQSPADHPQAVKDYIQEAKAHVSQTCQYMEPGLSLDAHYVDVRLSPREILCSGKNTNKCLDKELVIMGDTDRQSSMLGHAQVFEGSSGEKSKRYILLLGNAGMGKTSLIKKLCLDWSRDHVPQFDFVFLLDGKKLSVTEPAYSLQTLLLQLSSIAPPCVDPEVVYAQILADPKRTLIIFDGFSELRDYETLLQAQDKDLVSSLQRDSKAQSFTVRQLYSAVLQRVLLSGCTLLLSTRPRGTATQLLRRADCFLEVCGFTPKNIETYVSQFFSDPALSSAAQDRLHRSSYLHLLCWNPGLCRLICLLLEHHKQSELPGSLTGLCHQVLSLIVETDSRRTHSDTETGVIVASDSSQVKRGHRNRSRSQVHSSAPTQRVRRTRNRERQVDKVDEDMKSVGGDTESTVDRQLLSQLSALAWEGVKANTSVLPTGRAASARLQAFGLRTGLLLSHHLRTRILVSEGEEEGGERTHRSEDESILLWASPFLQSYMAALHLSLSSLSDRAFLLTLPFQSGAKGRRRPQREELELTQRLAIGLLFHSRTELQSLHSYTDVVFRDMLSSKQALVTKHLEGLCYAELSPSQLLEACHYVYEAGFTQNQSSRDAVHLMTHLAENLPEFLTLRGVPLSPPDVFTVQKALERGGAEGRSFCLDLEDSGIQICGLRALVGLSNINTYRACIADVITLWEQLEQSAEEELLQGAVSKFKIHPLKATQVFHVQHLQKLVSMHVHKRITDSSSESILAEGVPAVHELHKLEFELGPDRGPLALPQLWDLLPGLQNLQHVDLENSKIGDTGAEKLAAALVSLCLLEVLNLSQNCIGDCGVQKLVTTLKDLPRLHCLSLYSNVISDEGAESLAAVLPHMAALTDLDVKYNKLTDVGAQSLASSLRSCKKMKTLRMWNQCMPYGVFERLQQQDGRILWH
ncbi:MHC class II transactivator isoform X2 [Parambassis ranga]|uniref:MHC class II transactivator isoform X2 n=1 Tax=Parambassis ranga TaxID=210632 RepID=A0A6P7IFK7_9TELE|nr:MHC class II transactivator isoform X2 [Parambassis ranga]